MSKTIELTDLERSLVEDALNAYWNEAEIQIQNEGKYTPFGKIFLGDIEKNLLEQRKNLIMPLIKRFEELD